MEGSVASPSSPSSSQACSSSSSSSNNFRSRFLDVFSPHGRHHRHSSASASSEHRSISPSFVRGRSTSGGDGGGGDAVGGGHDVGGDAGGGDGSTAAGISSPSSSPARLPSEGGLRVMLIYDPWPDSSSRKPLNITQP